jgi:hypothetical protein
LDRCIPRRLREQFSSDHIVVHASEVPWGAETNGKLVRSASEAKFDVLITVDRNMRFQTPLAGLPLSVVIIHSHSNRLGVLQQRLPELLEALERTEPGTYLDLALPSAR